jgi:2-polyprenyl-3-methyl-5-hydroxy-6-metoxy-1,4-benzoquinol methylase
MATCFLSMITKVAAEQMNVSQCVVCAHRGADQLYAGILKCRGCGYVYADMSLTDEELFTLYNEQFFSGAEFVDYVADESFLRKNVRLRLKVLEKFLDPARHRRLLEVGSAYGFFLDEVKSHFESVQGIDITDAGVRHASEKLKLDVVQADFLAHNYGEQRFDVVCLWDTIEHLRAPQLYIEKIARYTEPGAFLAITTADVQSLNARLRGESWRMFHPPTHLHYFSSATLTRLLDRHGFDVVYNRYCGFHRSLGNVAYNILVLRQQRSKLFKALAKTGLTRLGFYLNLYDIMYVIAQRR